MYVIGDRLNNTDYKKQVSFQAFICIIIIIAMRTHSKFYV